MTRKADVGDAGEGLGLLPSWMGSESQELERTSTWRARGGAKMQARPSIQGPIDRSLP